MEGDFLLGYTIHTYWGSILASKTGYKPFSNSENQWCSSSHIHIYQSFIPLSAKGENSPCWTSTCYSQTVLGHFLGESQKAKSMPRTMLTMKHLKKKKKKATCPDPYLSVIVPLKSRTINVLDAFVSPQPHTLLTCFLGQPSIFLYGPEILSEDPPCYLCLVPDILRLEVTRRKRPSLRKDET